MAGLPRRPAPPGDEPGQDRPHRVAGLGLWHLPLFWMVANFRTFGVGGAIGWAVGLGFGSVFLTWLYQSASCSILIVALWHTAYNFSTATEASSGGAAVVATAVVATAAVVILRRPATWMSPTVDKEPRVD